MTRRIRIMLTAVLLAAASLRGQSLDSLPPYQPSQTVSGTLRIWGDDRMVGIMKSFEQGFRRYHPEVRFETNLMGSGTGMAGLYTGVADIAFMGRASTAKEIMAFEWVFQYKPLALEVMTGSLDVPGKSPALVVFVHKDNPISQLTLAQLDAIFSCEHRRGPGRIRTWDQLGLKGRWTHKPITAYVYDAQTGSGVFFRQVVLNDSRKWNWDVIKEFEDLKKPDGSAYDAGQQILDALAGDPYGIAVSSLGYVNPKVKALALAFQEQGPYYQANRENLVQRSYPLSRGIFAYVNRAPDKAIDPKVKEFLRYILSREGQHAVVEEGDFLPLTEKMTGEQRRKIE